MLPYENVEFRYRGELPPSSNSILKEYDRIQWEFISLDKDGITFKYIFWKDGDIVKIRTQKNKIRYKRKTKTCAVLFNTATLDITNLLISLSNELFGMCRMRVNDRCILTRVEN